MSTWCPTCHNEFEGEGPPYNVLHVVGSNEHLHPISRKPVSPREPAHQLVARLYAEFAGDDARRRQ